MEDDLPWKTTSKMKTRNTAMLNKDIKSKHDIRHDTQHDTQHDTKHTSVKKYSKLKKAVSCIWNVSSIYIAWILLHHLAANLYALYCTPMTLFGIFASPFIIASPHCVGLRWCINRGADTIVAMWVILGSWAATSLTRPTCGN